MSSHPPQENRPLAALDKLDQRVLREHIEDMEREAGWELRERYASSKGPKCPYCEHQHDANTNPLFYEDGFSNRKCESCGRVYGLSVIVRFSWRTNNRPEPTDV